MPIRKQNGKWIVDVTYTLPTGKTIRVRRASPVQTKPGARTYEQQVRRSIMDGTCKAVEGLDLELKVEMPAAKPKPTFGSFAEQFLDYHRTQVGPGTLKNYEATIEHHFGPAFEGLRIDEIDALGVDKYVAEAAKKLTAGTVNNHISQLNQILEKAQKWGMIEKAPKVSKIKKTEDDEFDFLTFEECEKLLEASKGTKWYPVFLVAVRTGLRIGELSALTWDDIDFENNRVRVSKSYGNVSGLGSTKSGRPREVPLSWDARKALEELQETKRGKSVFGEGDEPMSHRSMAGALEKYSTIACGRKVSPHSLRHTAASHAIMRGVHLAKVKEWLGHRNVQDTMRYAHLAPKVRDESIDLLAPQKTE
jgi:integrase